MRPETFSPSLFISVGATGAMFTLRETYLATVPGPGPFGNAVVNGVYQGSYEVRSHHLVNLATTPDEAFAKAEEQAELMGLPLTSNRARLDEELRTIQRSTPEQMAERRAADAKRDAEREAAYQAYRAEWEAKERDALAQGLFARGPYAGKPFEEAPVGYLNWLMDTLQDFEEGSTMRAQAVAVEAKCSHLRLPKPAPGVVLGKPKQRLTLDVTLVRCAHYDRASFSGYGTERVYIVTMVDKATGACVVSKSTAFSGDVGEVLQIKATVKEHSEFRGQAQTVVQRIAVIGE